MKVAMITHAAPGDTLCDLIRKGAHARLILAVELIGQGVSIEVDAADVKPY